MFTCIRLIGINAHGMEFRLNTYERSTHIAMTLVQQGLRMLAKGEQKVQIEELANGQQRRVWDLNYDIQVADVVEDIVAEPKPERPRWMREEYAFAAPAMPCNPRPFLRKMMELCEEHGTGAVKRSDFQACLWVVMSQSYGQMAEINLSDEWSRLYKVLDAGSLVEEQLERAGI